MPNSSLKLAFNIYNFSSRISKKLSRKAQISQNKNSKEVKGKKVSFSLTTKQI